MLRRQATTAVSLAFVSALAACAQKPGDTKPTTGYQPSATSAQNAAPATPEPSYKPVEFKQATATFADGRKASTNFFVSKGGIKGDIGCLAQGLDNANNLMYGQCGPYTSTTQGVVSTVLGTGNMVGNIAGGAGLLTSAIRGGSGQQSVIGGATLQESANGSLKFTIGTGPVRPGAPVQYINNEITGGVKNSNVLITSGQTFGLGAPINNFGD